MYCGWCWLYQRELSAPAAECAQTTAAPAHAQEAGLDYRRNCRRPVLFAPALALAPAHGLLSLAALVDVASLPQCLVLQDYLTT